MFPRGPRFLPPNIPDVPGPNTYNVAQDTQSEAYKRGAFLEKADRFSKDKLSEVPGLSAYDTNPKSHNIKSTAKNPAPPAQLADRCKTLQKRIEDLEKLHIDDKRLHQADVERLSLELAQCKKSNAEQAERLEKQKKQGEAREVRIHELKKTTSADQAEIKALRSKLRTSEHERVMLSTKQEETAENKRAIQAVESKRREEIREKDKVIADLEKSVALEGRKRELAEARVDELRGKNDEKSQEARAAAQRLELQLNGARDEARQAKSALAALDSERSSEEQELVAQLEQCRSTLAKVAEQYGYLASTTIPISTHSRVKHEHSSLQMRVFRLECKLANAEGQVVELANLIRHTKEKNTLLSAQLKDAEDEVAYYSRALEDLTNNRDDRSDVILERAVQDQLTAIANDVLDSKRQSMAERTLESETACQIYRLICQEALPLCSTLDLSIQEKEVLVRKYVADLTTISRTNATLALQLDTVRAEYEERKRTLGALEASSHTSQQRLIEVEANMTAEVSKREEALNKERDLVQRLNSTVQKSRMAEEALRIEIEQLKTELVDLERYQGAYYSLYDEVDTLIARNELAEGEAQRLSKMNAEILGHTNPAQRILYVDRIRKELAETKQKLLMSTRDHEAAVADGNNLRHEVAMYRSVTIPIENKPKTHITRIARPALANQNLNVTANRGHLGTAVEDSSPSLGEMTLEEIA